MDNAPAPVVRQPFPKSPSSTDHSTLPSPTSTWTSFSATTSHGGLTPPEHREDFRPISTSQQLGGPTNGTTIIDKWSSNHTFLGALYPDTNVSIGRARSPSAPNLTSQTYVQPEPFEAQEVGLIRQFDQLSIGKPSSPFPAYQPRPFLHRDSFEQKAIYPTAHLRQYDEDEDEDDATPLHGFYQARGNSFNRTIHHSFPGQGALDHHLPHHNSAPILPRSGAAHSLQRYGTQSISTLSRPKGGKNVYFADLDPRRITEQDLERYGSKFGRVIMTRLQAVRDASADVLDNGLSEPKPQRHCGFVLFDNHGSAAAMIKHFRSAGHQCDYAKEDFQTEWKSLEDPESANLYIQGLPSSFTSGQLHDLLAPFGKVVSHRFTTSGEGYRRGPVLARLECRPQADRAIRQLNGSILKSTGQLLQVRISDSDAQKAFKRDANADWTEGTVGARGDCHRYNLASQDSGHLGEAEMLDHKRRQLVAALQALEAQKADLFIPSQPYSQRGYDRDYRATPFAPLCDDHFQRSHYGRQASISSLSTHRTASMQSTDTSIWTPPASRTASGQFGGHRISESGYNYSPTMTKIHGDSLHHIRSTPDLEGDITSRLWPGHANDL